MSKKTVTIENIDSKLLFEQKCDLLDVIGFLEPLYEKYPRSMAHFKKKIASLDGVINMLNTISDQIEKD